MTLVATPGYYIPPKPYTNIMPGFGAVGTIDDTGEKIAFIGRVWTPSGTAKNISGFGIRLSTVVKAGGSGFTASLQDVDLSNGPVYRPDGTPDQTCAIANGNANLVSNGFLTGTFSSTRAVNPGDLIAFVFEFDGSGRLGSDSVIVSSISGITTNSKNLVAGAATFTSGAWAASSGLSALLLIFDDGTYGTLDSNFVCSAASTIAFNSGSATDEVGNQFVAPFGMVVDGAWGLLNAASGADFDIVLSGPSGDMTYAAHDSNVLEATGANRFFETVFATPQTLTAGQTYQISARPTTANNLTLAYFDVANAAHFQAHRCEQSMIYAGRVNGGSWTTTTTRRAFLGISVSHIDIPSGGGGGYPASRVKLGM